MEKFLNLDGLRQVTESFQQRLNGKQDQLTGQPGQLVGFGEDGRPTARCPSLAEITGGSNPNLLDNWYFVKPINQRGQLEYIADKTTPSYCIDRWRHQSGAVTVNQDGISWGNPESSGACIFSQIVENASMYSGKELTLSVLVKNGPVYSATLTVNPLSRAEKKIQISDVPDMIFAIILDSASDTISVQLRKDSCQFTIDLVAMKLEPGSVQTLAHQDEDGSWVLNGPPPDKALELLKCQRYLKVFKRFEMFQPFNPPTATYIDFAVPVGIPMRATPVPVGTGFGDYPKKGFTVSVPVNCITQYRLRFKKENHGLTSAYPVAVTQEFAALSAEL